MFSLLANINLIDYHTDIISVCFAISGGLATQLKLISIQKIPYGIVVSELMISALSGFGTHALFMLKQDMDIRIILTASAVAGGLGAKAWTAIGKQIVPWMYKHEDK